ncbi:MFS transporter [Flavobacterium rhizosphaerae]|uniref:MFS transporter n=1 Tax=Flavobacterium rhizosphaerae TaxID=3163298 RepID=A0ABW8YYH6_9FLAO
MSSDTSQTKWAQFIPLVSVFFFWGFVAASNDILIPVFKTKFDLNQLQSQMVAFAFYVAYTVGSLIYIGISAARKKDIVEDLGYKNSLAVGLFISAIGCMFFYPAAELESFPLMLSGLFVVGLGFSLQQTVANPLAIALGPIKTGAQRLTLAGGINNLGTTIGPLLVSFAIFGVVAADAAPVDIDINTVKLPYLILGVAFVVVAVLLKFSSLPNHPDIIEEDVATDVVAPKKSALQYPQLIMGMFAIFLYVGVEVATASNLPAYLEENLGFATREVAPYVSLYWASLMMGRWGGAAEAFTDNRSIQTVLKIVAPYLAFAVFLGVNVVMGHDLEPFYKYAAIIIVLIIADFASKGNPANMLGIFALLGIAALIIGMLTEGSISIYAFTSVGLFCSTLWPCIFTLAVSGLGKHTSQGSNLLVMMIMGGGLVPLAQGWVSGFVGIHHSYIVGVVCFAYLAFYAFRVQGILKSQGINLGRVSGGH